MGLILFACADETLKNNVLKNIDSGNNTEVIVTTNETAIEDIKAIDREITLVVSRGGLGQFIAENTDYHVIFLKISVVDVVNQVQELKRQGATHVAVLGTVVWMEKTLESFAEEILGCKFMIALNREERHRILRSLKSQGFDAVITIEKDLELARENGLLCTPLITSDRAIIEAYSEAKFLADAIENEQLRTRQVKTLLDSSEDALVMIKGTEITYANAGAEKLFMKEQLTADSLSVYLYMHNVTTMINDNPMLVNSTTYSMPNGQYGYMLSFKYATNIHKSEQIIRNAQSKGFIAKYTFDNIICESNTARRSIEIAKQYASCDSNILIEGETGTGKELFAQSIHNASARKGHPFVSINCASIPADIFESELFGRVDSVSGGRHTGKYGLFELAHGGTLFLDEVSSLPLELQARLLRVLQEKELFRIGDEKVIPVDVRIISATNKNLLECISERKFRDDLYYRLNVLSLSVPSLKARKADIIPLYNYFLNEYENKYRTRLHIDEKPCKTLLEGYDWPGNIRELKNIAERSVLLCSSGVITADFLADLLVAERDYLSSQHTEKGQKRRRKPGKEELQRLLQLYSKQDICTMLGISRTTLWRMEQEL